MRRRAGEVWDQGPWEGLGGAGRCSQLSSSFRSSVLGAMESSWSEPSIVLKVALLDRCLLCACPGGELLLRTCSLHTTMMVIPNMEDVAR